MKLRASAAKVRKLVPYVYGLCQELADAEDPVEEAMCTAAKHLNACYESLSSSQEAATADLKTHSIKFALQYVALHDRLNASDDRVFRIKPKMHFFLHLCSDGGNPAKHWCYRDEDFGGSIAKVAHRRGGLDKPQSLSNRVLSALNIRNGRISIR